ncbi:putative two-component sensor [Desulfovibrio sp. DV]|uniref:transporter substrate-binding domain-containing protein n=1 Tax=Desulfovibrio sp. DV TaxID=1844708 RepID=UPI00096452B1|nr:transporter substrate-binding domain-containing protein [Desulfovibrio sp. DV]OLN24924.1 putative two-component sensor [Desulfovibrio sp. DV]
MRQFAAIPLTLACVVLVFVCLGAPAGAEGIPGVTRPVVVGGDRDYPPYEFLDKDGLPAGFNVDLSRAIGEVMGLRIEFRLGAWAEMRQALLDGEVDILEGMSFSEERAAGEVDFAPPSAVVNHAIFARKGERVARSLDDLAGRTVIVHRRGYMHDRLAGMGNEKDLILVDTPADGLRLLASGLGDFAVVAMLPGNYIIKDNKLDNIEVVARSVATLRYGFAVKKGNEALLARFSEGLAILRGTGQYEALYNKWLGVLEDRPLPWTTVARYAAAVALPLLALLGGTVLWSHSLRRQVAQRTASLSRALDELSRNQRQLVEADKMAALGILVSGVAHEINNPNGLILLNIPILRKAQADCARILERRFKEEGDFLLGGIPYSRMRHELPRLLEEMQEGALRIKRIVNDLKDFARREEGAGRTLIDVADASRKAVRLLDAAIRKATDHFTADYDPDLPLVLGNSQRIEQVIVNLILNACQALPERSRAIAVRVRHDEAAGRVVLTVRDEGSGIAPEHLPHLTDPFFTTKRETGGTGLGLSVSAGILKEYGGVLTFVSAPGQGTTAAIAFPAATEEPAA